MTTAIVTVHFRNGIWNADAGFAFNLALVACAYVAELWRRLQLTSRADQFDQAPLGLGVRWHEHLEADA